MGSCDRKVVTAVFGASVEDHGLYGSLGGSRYAYRTYGPTAGAPQQITVWFDSEDRAIVIRIQGPVPSASLNELLGEPQMVLDSQFSSLMSQLV